MAPEDPLTVRGCEDGAKAAPQSARPLIFLAEARLIAKNPQGAADALAQSVALLTSGADDAIEAWPVLASIARRASCVTIAEQAAAHSAKSADTDAVVAWIHSTRRWSGLSAALPQCEFEHVERFREAQKLLDRHELGAVIKRIAWFPEGPARDTLSCELALRRHSMSEAHRACDKAVAAWPESTLGHYLLGVMAEIERRPAEVEAQLTRVIDLDPGIDDAYVRLAVALRSLGKTGALEELKARYQTRFKEALRY